MPIANVFDALSDLLRKMYTCTMIDEEEFKSKFEEMAVALKEICDGLTEEEYNGVSDKIITPVDELIEYWSGVKEKL